MENYIEPLGAVAGESRTEKIYSEDQLQSVVKIAFEVYDKFLNDIEKGRIQFVTEKRFYSRAEVEAIVEASRREKR